MPSPSLSRSPRTRTRHSTTRRHAFISVHNKPLPPAPPHYDDNFNLTLSQLGLSFDFPHPPSIRSISPPPSLSTSSPTSNCSALPLTPSSSDDDSFYSPSPSPSFLPRRATIKPLIIVKHGSESTKQQGSQCSLSTSWIDDSDSDSDSDDDDDIESNSDSEEASEWYSREFSQIISLSSPLPPHLATSSARESIFVSQPHRVRTASDPVPSLQLDPAYITTPVPTVVTPSTPVSPRPPPRTPLPADVRSPEEEYDEEDARSMYSLEARLNLLTVDEENDERRIPVELSFSPLDLETDVGFGLLELERRNKKRESESGGKDGGRALRSRWSTSTVATVRDEKRSTSAGTIRQSAASKLRFFHFGSGGGGGGGGGRKEREKASVPSSSPPSSWYTSSHSHSSSHNSLWSMTTAKGRWSKESRASMTLMPMRPGVVELDRDRYRLRSGSGSSGRKSEDSYESAWNTGSRRKPIPIEMFLRSS